jgi:hypothetical protein
MRGTIAGKGDIVVDTASEMNAAVQPAFEIKQGGSHTLQSSDFADGRDLRARLIEAAVKATADDSDPRLDRSRPLP